MRPSAAGVETAKATGRPVAFDVPGAFFLFFFFQIAGIRFSFGLFWVFFVDFRHMLASNAGLGFAK